MNAKQALTQWFESVWYGERHWAKYALLPLSYLFCAVALARKQRLQAVQVSAAVPVIVVGNIAVGGTGKTPLVLALIKQLRAAGFNPGVVSRGVGAKIAQPYQVTAHDRAEQVGDEPLLLVQRSQVPLVIGRDRVAAIEALVATNNCDLIISDDGLQHYRMGRDLEIAVIDGSRRLGNGECLPAGPLRERASRLQDCDFVIVNGQASHASEYSMQTKIVRCYRLSDGEQRDLNTFKGQHLHVVTAIGNPARFLASLTPFGLQLDTHLYPDHHPFQVQELTFAEPWPMLMTEKDAVKCQTFPAELKAKIWVVAIEAELEPRFLADFLTKVQDVMQRG